MRNMRWQRIIAFLTALMLMICLCHGTMAEQASLIPGWAESGLMSLPLHLNLRAEMTTAVPLDEVRTGKLNALLSHVSLDLVTQQVSGGTWEKATLYVDGESATQLTRRSDKDGQSWLQLSAMPDATYISREADPLTMLLGSDSDVTSLMPEEVLNALTYSAWVDAAADMLIYLPEALSAWSKTALIKTAIKDVGTATQRVTVTIPKADTETLGGLLAACCREASLAAWLSELSFEGKQTIQIYRNATDDVIKLTWRGYIQGRDVDLSWRLCRTSSLVIDDFTLKSPSLKGSDRDTVSFARKIRQEGDSGATLSLSLTDDFVRERKKTVWTAGAELTAAYEAEATRLTGSVTLRKSQTDEQLDWRYEPDLTFTQSQPMKAEGSLNIAFSEDKHEQLAMRLTGTLSHSDYFDWTLTPRTIQLDESTESALSAMADEVSSLVSADVIARLVLLPEEDVLFISEGLGTEQWQQIRESARKRLSPAIKP